MTSSLIPATALVDAGGARLNTARWGVGPPNIVLLHDGLGSIAQWGDLPADLHLRTGATVLAYDRAGHGISTPTPDGPWPTDWLHQQEVVLGALLDTLSIDLPMLVGHSDGGSIALLHAAAHSADAVVALAAHTFVEPVCTAAIRAMRDDADRWVSGLSRHHAEPRHLFEAWSGVWVSDAFESWDVRPQLSSVRCPTLVVQGSDDEYATDMQLNTTVEAIGPNAQAHCIEGARHILHRDVPDQLVELIATFYDQHAAGHAADEGD